MSYTYLIWKDRPDITWPLDNISSTSSYSNAFNILTTSRFDYSASINVTVSDVISVPMIYGGNTSLRLTSSSVAGLTIPLLGRFSERYSRRESSLSFWLKCDMVPSGSATIAKKRGATEATGLYLNENYLVYRYGTTSSYLEVAYGLADLRTPTHIVLNNSMSGIQMIVDGNSVTANRGNFYPPIDSSHTSNDFMDFYGNENFGVYIDSPAIFAKQIDEIIAKRHTVYGLGRSANEKSFFILGGDFYNMAGNVTRKSFTAYWDWPTDWQLIRYDNLTCTPDGITTISQPEPELYSYDNYITKTSDSIRFSAASTTIGSYISVPSLSRIFNEEDTLFFTKVRLDGQLPLLGNSQTIMSYSYLPLDEVFTVNIENRSGSYVLTAVVPESNSTASILIPTVSSSPIMYVGIGYSEYSKLYLSMSGSSTITASFSYTSASNYTADPLSEHFPPSQENAIRIGGRTVYNDVVDAAQSSSVNQFTGTFLKFMVGAASMTTASYSSIDSFIRSPYSFTYSTSKNRFVVQSFGNANFIVHGNAIADQKLGGSAVISSNRIEFGYPDVVSGSQVKIYATLYDYSDNVIVPKTQLSQVNHLQWLNLVDLSNRYLLFDIDINSFDCTEYQPIMKYFYMETYPCTGSYTDIFDDGGDRIRIRSASNAAIFLPEINKTPTTILNKDSGIRVYRNFVDVEFSPAEKPYIMPSSGSMSLWLDARYSNGFFTTPPNDSAAETSWFDLSSSVISVTSNSSSWPQFRSQSLNLLQLSHALGGDIYGTRNTNVNANTTASVSDDTSQSGEYSFKLSPTGVSNDSFMFLGGTGFGSFREGILPNRQYTMIGTITLTKTQESSSINSSARRMNISASQSGGTVGYSTNQAPNQIGSHTVSATFTTGAGILANQIRLYNGSSSPSDVVYWDNIALYSGSTVSGSPVKWYSPYEHDNDRQCIRFYTSSAFMTASMSIKQPITIYLIARSFGDGGLVGGGTASAPSIYINSGSFRMSAGASIGGPINNDDFNLIVGVFNGNSSSLIVGSTIVTGAIGSGSFTSAGMTIGRSLPSATSSAFLNGDFSLVAVYNSAHSRSTIDQISYSLREEFNIP